MNPAHPSADDTRPIAGNRKAFHDYFVEDKIEADGASQQMQLDGWAVDEKRFAFVLQDRSRRA